MARYSVFEKGTRGHFAPAFRMLPQSVSFLETDWFFIQTLKNKKEKKTK